MNPEAYNAQVLEALKSLGRDVAEIKGMLLALSAGRQPSGSQEPAASKGPRGDAPKVASDMDLDSEHGNPLIKFDPSSKYWVGESFKGYRFSETSAEYLDATAKYLDACAYMAARDPDEKKQRGARYKALDAARARGWAKRMRDGVVPQGGGGGQAPFEYDTPDGGDDIPFIRHAQSWMRP